MQEKIKKKMRILHIVHTLVIAFPAGYAIIQIGGGCDMNVLFLLTPKANLTYIYEDYTIRQALERMEAGR